MAQLQKVTRQVVGVIRRWVHRHVTNFVAFQQPRLWLLAVGIGLVGGLLGIAFRHGIGAVQSLWLGTGTESVVTALAGFPWWWPVLGPLAGGIAVGVILFFWRPPGRSGGVADIIELRARETDDITIKDAAIATVISAITLGSGGSAGREGPVVYAAGAAARLVTRAAGLKSTARRIVLACSVAAVISSSFNAPIAGVLFAHEVILGHFAMTAFVPLVIGAVVAAVISRAWFGETAAFVVPDYQISSYLEVPAFALLGVTCALVAIMFQSALIAGNWTSKRVSVPIWLRPPIGGLLVGLIALAFPHVLGVGYEAAGHALWGSLDLSLMIALIAAKTVATAITLSSRAGGGIVSPSLYLGAMTGGAFGIMATSAFPEFSSSIGLYAVIGMGAVAAAVLGAPISTAVMIFELTGGFAFSLALLLCVAISTGLCQAVMGRSFFHWQLYARGLVFAEGPHQHTAKFIRVREFMHVEPNDEDGPFDLQSGDPFLRPEDSLETALGTFESSSRNSLPVVDGKTGRVLGHARHVDALHRFNKALVALSREEHS